jgi:fructose-specific phosphotransferase system component IIB
MSEYIEVGQPLQFTDPNTPTRAGEIVENVSDIYNITSPRLGMQVFVKSEKKSYVITALKSKTINGVEVPEAAVEAFEPVGAKSITWNNDTDLSNMNDFVVAGVYDIKGEHKRKDDNLPVLNTSGGHSFNARLTVLDSSISGSGEDDDKCITQVLSFSNRLGQGEVYIRTGKGGSLDNLTWEKWSTLQRNVNVGELNSKRDLGNYIDNGIYSGVFRYGSSINDLRAFVMIVINDYAIGMSPRRVSQFLYSIDKATGKVSYEVQTCEDETWKEWEILNKSEIDSMISVTVDNAIKGYVTAIYNDIQQNTVKINTETNRAKGVENKIKQNTIAANSMVYSTTTDDISLEYETLDGNSHGSVTFPAATTEKAGVMTAEDKKTLDNVFGEITADKKLLCKTYTPNEYYGLYCSNVTTGEIKNATTSTNGLLIKVSPGEIYRVEGDSFLHTSNMPFFSDVPTIKNYSGVYVGYKSYIGGLVVVPKDAVYMLVSVKNAATATARIELVGWGDRIVSNALATMSRNVGSEYVEYSGNLKTGVALDMRHFYNLTINEGDSLEFIAETDSDVKYRILTGDGKNVEGNAIYYNSNVLYRVNIHTIFVTSLRNATRWGLFVDVANATANTSIRFRARIIKNDSFSYDSKIKRLSDEIGVSVNNPYSKYELFTLGDSLSSGGVWQAKVAELIGCTFDQSKNVKPGAMLSVGGTYSYGDSFDNVLWRAKNLIDKGYIADDGENAIVILENVNDGYVAFDEGAKSLIPTDPIEGYTLADFGSALLESIADKARLNAVLRLTKTQSGKNLKITTLPTKPGTITLRVGWAGPGVSTYNIQIEPKSTTEETLAGIIDKIMEYAYTGVTDTLGDDGASVDFCSSNPNYMPTVEFNDTGNTGMRVTITDNPNAKGSVAKFFIGDSVGEWNDTSKWVVPSYSQGWKSTIELLQRTYPKLHIFISQFPMHSVTASEYLLPNGSYDSVAYNSTGRMVDMRKMEVELKKIADFYSLPFLNVFRECGIGINNMLTYYNASANVHPKNEGYYRFGETVAAQLKRFLP